MKVRARAGFTIVEVVVAMGVLLLGMSSILGLLSFGAALSRAAELRTVGSSVVAAVVADLEERLFPLESDDPFAPAGAPPAEVEGALPGGVRYVARTTPLAGDPRAAGAGPAQPEGLALEYRVDIEVTWQSSGELRRRQFTTLLVREVPFGERLRRKFIEGRTEGD